MRLSHLSFMDHPEPFSRILWLFREFVRQSLLISARRADIANPAFTNFPATTTKPGMHFMNFIITILALQAMAAADEARSPRTALIDLQIESLSPIEGQLRLAVFCSPDSYRQLRADEALEVLVVSSVVRTELAMDPAECVFLVHHDVNADGRMNTGLFGIPAEPTAVSNNARTRFGLPDWEDAHVDIPDGRTLLTIRF